MNGIYDFERYRPPRLDEEMLMERKAEKQKKVMMVFLGIAMTLIAILSVVVLFMISKINQEIFNIACVIFILYILVGTIIVSDFIKKEREKECELQV